MVVIRFSVICSSTKMRDTHRLKDSVRVCVCVCVCVRCACACVRAMNRVMEAIERNDSP